MGLRGKNYAVLAAFKKRQQEQFASYDKKLFKIDEHCAVGISGLTADARILDRYSHSRRGRNAPKSTSWGVVERE